MSNDTSTVHALSVEELEAQSAEVLPERELMGNLIKVGPVLPSAKIKVKL